MAGAEAAHHKRTWPIVYGPRPTVTPEASPRLAWALFIVLGLPFVLMTILTVLGDAGIRLPFFGLLWMPWPPEVLKPFIGLGVFAATLGYLAYRLGHRSGFHAGTGVGLAAARNFAEARPPVSKAEANPETQEVPPPPPEGPDAETRAVPPPAP